jgi:hypothetical protein
VFWILSCCRVGWEDGGVVLGVGRTFITRYSLTITIGSQPAKQHISNHCISNNSKHR